MAHWSDNILKTTIEKAIKKQLKVDVFVEEVHLNLITGSIEISSLRIANPPGYKSDNILEVESISIKADIRSFVSDTIEVNQVNLNNVAVVIEQKGSTNNLSDILMSVKKPEAKTEKTGRKNKNIHIASVDIQNINVTAKLLPVSGKFNTVRLKTSELHLSGIRGEKTTLSDQ
jgi:hypothetical protein